MKLRIKINAEMKREGGKSDTHAHLHCGNIYIYTADCRLHHHRDDYYIFRPNVINQALGYIQPHDKSPNITSNWTNSVPVFGLDLESERAKIIEQRTQNGGDASVSLIFTWLQTILYHFFLSLSLSRILSILPRNRNYISIGVFCFQWWRCNWTHTRLIWSVQEFFTHTSVLLSNNERCDGF